jgi:excisionase family DNA binding protein
MVGGCPHMRSVEIRSVTVTDRERERQERRRRERERRERQRRATLTERIYVPPDRFAVLAGVSRSTVWRAMRAKRLRYAHFGRVRRIPLSELDRLTSEA